MRLPQEDLCQATGEPGSLKYEAEGGPGMRKIMDILLGSVRSHEDRSLFMKIQLLFWMLGAIDGHAKNFSIYPVVAAKQLDIERVTMAMAVLGSNRHYRWDRIVRRHWPETARQCRFDPQEFESLIEECCDLAPGCIATVEQEIPAGFPAMIADAIFSFLLRARDRLRKS
jgi:serine/threonine-protein kinase HipA